MNSTVLNIDNNTNVSWSTNQHIRWFLNDHVTLKTGVIAAENVALITGINYIFKYIQQLF